jgi:hypothetical protein
MDPRERLRAQLAGAGCSACGAGVPADGIAILADRGDVAFVELRCPGCGSETMGVVVAGDAGVTGSARLLDAPDLGDVHPRGGHPEEAHAAGTAEPVALDDVLAVRELLAGWDGDLRSLLAGRGSSPPDSDRT